MPSISIWPNCASRRSRSSRLPSTSIPGFRASGLAPSSRTRCRSGLLTGRIRSLGRMGSCFRIIRLSLLHPEQPRRIATQNGDLLFVRQRRGREDVIDGMLFPWDRMVGAEHDLAGADLRHQMPQTFRREHHGVEIELVEIFRRLLLQRDVRIAILGRHETGMIAARTVGAQIAAAMRGNDLESRKAVEGSL